MECHPPLVTVVLAAVVKHQVITNCFFSKKFFSLAVIHLDSEGAVTNYYNYMLSMFCIHVKPPITYPCDDYVLYFLVVTARHNKIFT